jgi:hypothetical protein
MKDRIEYLTAALILAVIIAAVIAFWLALLFGVLWVCAEWPTATACIIVAALFANFLKQLTD